MPVVTLARHAMATRFELVLCGGNATALRAAGEAALEEIERLEERLSLFRPGSEIAHVNACAAREPVRVTPEVFVLLEHARCLHRDTLGAFDITIGPLMRCWGFRTGQGRLPTQDQLAEARARVGMHLVELNPADFTVQFAREGVVLDLGAIGKGYAIERAAELLTEAGVESALLHGGTSTVYGLGKPPEADTWRVGIASPPSRATPPHTKGPQAESRAGAAQIVLLPAGENKTPESGSPAPLTVVSLKDEALSVSAVWGKFFEADGQTFGHIIDPRDGRPAARAVLAAVAMDSATETDALSTALLTLGLDGLEQLRQIRPGARSLVATESAEGLEVRACGLDLAVTAR